MFDTIFMKIIIIIFLSSIKIFLKYFVSQYFYFWEEINIFKALLFFFLTSLQKKYYEIIVIFFFWWYNENLVHIKIVKKEYANEPMRALGFIKKKKKKKRALGVWCGSRIVTNIICHTDSHRVRQSGRHTHHSA